MCKKQRERSRIRGSAPAEIILASVYKGKYASNRGCFGVFQRYPQSAYRDVRGAKVTTKRLRFALHRPFSPLYTDARLFI